MKKQVRILLIAILVAVTAFCGCKSGDGGLKNVEIPDTDKTTEDAKTESTGSDAATGDARGLISADLQEDEIVYIDDMSVDEITKYLRGKVFQLGSYHAAAGIGAVMCFTPEGNEYYWFCSSMDGQSRIRAEYGVWELDDGFITTTTQKLVEWIDGHFTAAFGSTGSRFELEDYNEVLTKVDIESWNNFRMFKFNNEFSGEELGFSWMGDYYYCPAVADFDYLKEYYENYFSLLEK